MRTDEIPVVRQLPLFADMADDAFSQMIQAAYLQTFPPQVQLITEGDPADFLHVMVEGCVELFARGNGRETVMQLVRPVSTFILAAVLKDAPYLMSARTGEKSRILMIPAENVRVAFEGDAAFARSIVVELASSFRAVVKEQKNLKLRTGIERLANALLRLSKEQGDGRTFSLPCDKRTLAALLGMTPENLSRAFGTLRDYGVEVNGAEIRLARPEQLAALAKPSRLIDDPDS